ncbi:FapA family protein [Caloranaerobacter azorensis]|nr:FapA family protein [Caloranaerobacter azorensis]
MNDIEINGVVEGAVIESNGNIIVKRGIQGYHKGKLISRGNIYTKFIENSDIYADLDIHAEAIMHSKVISGNNIEVNGKKGLIVGGICKAKNEIRAKTVGSPMGTVTVLEVGIDIQLKSKYTEIKNKINEIKSNLEKLDKTIKLFTRLAKGNNLSDEKRKLLIKIIDSRKVLINQLNDLKEQLSSIEEK